MTPQDPLPLTADEEAADYTDPTDVTVLNEQLEAHGIALRVLVPSPTPEPGPAIDVERLAAKLPDLVRNAVSHMGDADTYYDVLAADILAALRDKP